VVKDEAQAAKSRAARDGLISTFDATFEVAVSQIEKYAVKPSDVADSGFDLFERTKYEVETPLSLSVLFDAHKEEIDVLVKHAPGMHAAFVEYCLDPIGATNPWKRIDGIAAEYHLTGFAPGRYWFRACAVRSAELSPFTTPVPIIVK
jgi:hypothetical protein